MDRIYEVGKDAHIFVRECAGGYTEYLEAMRMKT